MVFRYQAASWRLLVGAKARFRVARSRYSPTEGPCFRLGAWASMLRSKSSCRARSQRAAVAPKSRPSAHRGQGPSRSLGEELEEFVGGAEMTQDAEARMAVLIAIGLDDAPVVVAAHGVGLEAWHDSYIQYACAIVKADRNRLWWGSKHSKYGISLAFGDGAVRFERKW